RPAQRLDYARRARRRCGRSRVVGRTSLEDTQNEVPGGGEPRWADPMAVLRVLSRRRWLIAAFTAVVVGAVSIYTLRQPRIYETSASLIIDVAPPRFLDNQQVQEVVETGAGNYWYNKEYYETQYKVIVSRAVSERVVEKLSLDQDAAFLGLDKV